MFPTTTHSTTYFVFQKRFGTLNNSAAFAGCYIENLCYSSGLHHFRRSGGILPREVIYPRRVNNFYNQTLTTYSGKKPCLLQPFYEYLLSF